MRQCLGLIVMMAIAVASGGCNEARDLLIGPPTSSTSLPVAASTPCCEPLPTPTPEPTSTPTPIPTPTPEGHVPDNGNPVAMVDLVVFYYQCDGEVVPDTKYASVVPVGCKVVLDATPKDASRAPTRAKGLPQWQYSPAELVSTGSTNHTFTPNFTVLGPGQFFVSMSVDGVPSNSVTLSFVAR
jgi:hypothetical protein